MFGIVCALFNNQGTIPATMSDLRWKLRRLQAMSVGEIATRATRAVQERLKPLPKEPPQATWERRYNHAHTHHWNALLAERLRVYPDCLPEAERAALIAEADALLQGHWHLFGYPVQLDRPPRWNRNYLLGKEWHEAPAKALDYRRIDCAGGVKYVWELSRHQPLLRLAEAYALTHDAHYAETCLTWWLDWIERNPRGWGIHWTSALEHAVRVFVWFYCLRLLQDYAPVRDYLPVLGGAILQHGEFIERHLSPGSSANNHRIGEVAALAFAGSLLPDSSMTQHWHQKGFAMLAREAERQFYSDGVNAEQAFGYLPFVWEFYLHAYRVGTMPPSVRQRLAKSLEFVRNVMDSGGYVPQVGDEDDGTVVPLWSGSADRYRVVGRALASLLEVEPPPALCEANDSLTCWLWSKPALGGSRLTESRAYPEGGYVVFHNAHWQVLFDAGALGLGSLAAHGHSDALSVWASLDGKPFLVDAGTYAYHEEPAWRNYFRGTSAHNTVQMDDYHQSEMLGPFLWGRKARAYFVAVDLSVHTVEGTHEGYLPDEHRRRVEVSETCLKVLDYLIPDAMGALRWHWHFHPRWQVEPTDGGWLATDGETLCRITVEGLPPEAQYDLVHGSGDCPSVGWYSPRFGHRVPCTTLRVVVPTTHYKLDEDTPVRWCFRKTGEREGAVIPRT